MVNTGANVYMKIPPWYLWKEWRRFFTGMAIGGAISWCIFVFIFGVWQERLTKEIREQKVTIQELESDKEIWQEEFAALNKKNQEKMTVQEIKIKINSKSAAKFKLDSYSLFQVEESVKDDLNIMVAKDLETVYKSRDLLRRVIENKVVPLNNKRYRLEVTEIYIFTTLNIQVDIHLGN
jgi:hypothetical protein